MLKNKTKLNIFIFLLIILFISTGCVFNNGKKIKTSNNNQKVIQKNNKTNNKTKSPEQISSSTIKEDLNQKDNKQLAASTTETKDLDTSDWQTYRNEEYGFEIKYPPGWYIDNCYFDSSNKICIHNKDTIQYIKNWHKKHKNVPGPSEFNMIKISIYSIKNLQIRNNNDLKKWIIDNKGYVDIIKNQIIGKYNGIFASFPSITNDYNFYIKNNDIIIEFSTSESGNPEEENVFTNIIKSLKF